MAKRGKYYYKAIALRDKDRELGLTPKYSATDLNNTLNLFDNKCFNCGCKNKLSIDHLFPRSEYNEISSKNAVVLCEKCNSIKGSRMPWEFFSIEKINELINILQINDEDVFWKISHTCRKLTILTKINIKDELFRSADKLFYNKGDSIKFKTPLVDIYNRSKCVYFYVGNRPDKLIWDNTEWILRHSTGSTYYVPSKQLIFPFLKFLPMV